MPDSNEPRYWVYCVVADRAEARRLARILVEERRAACVNILGDIESVYWWQGKVSSGSEVALVAKTSQAALAGAIRRLVELHSYDCPAVVALPITDGFPDFLRWIGDETRADPPSDSAAR